MKNPCIDPYSEQGEFYDVLCPKIWQHRQVYLDVLSGLHDVEGVVMDIAAGTGHGVAAIASAIPDVEIIAVEPSRVMRAMLLSRAASSEDLRARLTVVPSTFEEMVMPSRVRAVLMLACLGLFDETARKGFWERIAGHMPPGGVILFDVMVDRPMTVDKMISAQGVVGRHTYVSEVEGRPLNDRDQLWLSTYSVLSDGKVIQQVHVEYVWHTVGLRDIADEAAPHGFAFEEVPADPRVPSGMLRRI